MRGVRGTLLSLLVIFVAVAVFVWSNGGTVTVMFWQWPLVTGSLGLVARTVASTPPSISQEISPMTRNRGRDYRKSWTPAK
jgi:pheromone shutdown protein TraB